MLLTITTTYEPATDLGYILHKNPFTSQYTEQAFGRAYVFFPVATKQECTAALLLDIDPIELVRGNKRRNTSMPLEQYVNDRPYVCSSLMSVAISRIFSKTLSGRCKNKPELAETRIPLTCRISVLPCRGGESFLNSLFEPLGYRVSAARHTLDEKFPEWGDSVYYTVELKKVSTVAELLNHLYVLIPVLDNQKHYYIDSAEIDKLMKHGEGWLAEHPEREQIVKRYLKYKSSYAREALERLKDSGPALPDEDEPNESPPEEAAEESLNLNEDRLGTVLSVLKSTGAKKVVDLGCGEGKLLKLLLKDRQFEKIVGLDVSIRSLEIASERLHLDDLPSMQKERVELIHGSLMYKDMRLSGFDAAAVIEVVEHLDKPRLTAFERTVFDFARPGTVVLSTPNREYNSLWENVGPDRLRHSDHRFEWTRAEFHEWAANISDRFGYAARFLDIGKPDDKLGSPTQMCIFTRLDIFDSGL